MNRRLVLVLAALTAGLANGCRTPDRVGTGEETASCCAAGTPAPTTYRVKGVVREVRPDRKSALVRHEAIPGYMAAMTMPIEVRDARELESVQVGDQIVFRLNVTETDGWMDQIEVLARAEAGDPKPAVDEVRVTRIVDELSEGDVLPDYTFVNEQKRTVRLSDFRGKALGLTFIYTRCPYPTFCPRQSSQFAEACQLLKRPSGGPENWHLLSLSFDPAHDTPSVLRAYARKYDYDPKRWSFLTGEMIDIDAITEQFGMFFARDGEGFSHNVRTVVLDPSRRITKIFVGNEWTAAELAAAVREAAR